MNILDFWIITILLLLMDFGVLWK